MAHSFSMEDIYNDLIPLMKTKQFFSLACVLVILSVFGPSCRVKSASPSAEVPSFADFVQSLENGDPELIRGVYVPDVFAFPVLQQPLDDPGKVYATDSTVTQFRMASDYGVIGLLAHNNLAGALFPSLSSGQEIRIVYGDGKVRYFMVDRIVQFQVLQSDGQIRGYVDLGKDTFSTTQEVFSQFYEGDTHVTFQTCIQKGSNLSWGRLFVTAVPVPNYFFRQLLDLKLNGLQDHQMVIRLLRFFHTGYLFR